MVLGIYGAGGAGREVYDMIRSEKLLYDRWMEIVFIDDTVEEGEFYTLRRLPFSSFAEEYKPGAAEVIIAVGESASRKMLAERVKERGYNLANVISTTAMISPSAKIAKGVFVGSYSIVAADASLGENVWIGLYVHVGHDVHVAENCQLSSWSKFGGNTVVGSSAFVGLSACIREKTVIGHDAVVSMGAVVLRDVRPNRIVMGNPAREIAENTNHRIFNNKQSSDINRKEE